MKLIATPTPTPTPARSRKSSRESVQHARETQPNSSSSNSSQQQRHHQKKEEDGEWKPVHWFDMETVDAAVVKDVIDALDTTNRPRACLTRVESALTCNDRVHRLH
ncbi:hypothetical protein M0802_012715 [Mischocyttarus mexicanus]|nr:hypothetical protein M0802_012716 [Mischocyttarus mexicanus]KAI4485573.1 hypothetical protein M0802_012715 [Mischocyttarus mexicanus]